MVGDEAFPGLEETMAARVRRTLSAMATRGFGSVYVPTRQDTLAKLFELIPKGSAVAHGSSRTLEQIGFVARLKDPSSPYRYMNAEWVAETDPAKRARLRAELSVEADYFLGSVQAICETGEAIGADASGSRQAFYVFGPPHVIWVAGTNKLVPSLQDGIRRVREIALPLEDKRMKALGAAGSHVGKLVIYERERPGRTTLILVGEELGF